MFFVLFQPTVYFVDSKSVNQRLRDFQCVSLRSWEKIWRVASVGRSLSICRINLLKEMAVTEIA